MELNVDRRTNPAFASLFVVRNNCPAIIIPSDLLAPFVTDRTLKKSKYKIIASLGGTDFGLLKLRDIGQDVASADGFDITASLGLTKARARDEVKALTEFIRSVNPLAEIRWSIGPKSNFDNYKSLLEVIKDYPCNMIRTTPWGSDIESFIELITSIRKYTPTPIKFSGVIEFIIAQGILERERESRFDVTLDQANKLLRPAQPKQEEKKDEDQPPVDDVKVIGQVGQDVE
jgi:hypothetical protein